MATDFETFILIPQSKDNVIPKDLLGTARITKNIAVYGNDSSPESFCPEIHPKAFQSTKNFTKSFFIKSMDMAKINFTFLAEFNMLGHISLWNSMNVDLSSLPALNNLKNLEIKNCSGPNKWKSFPRLISGLNYISLEGNELNDEGAGRILDWILSGPSWKTLSYIILSRNALTRIPDQLKSFPLLITIFLDNQQKPGFDVLDPFSFTAPITYLNLERCYINEIQPNTFLGI